MTIHVASGGHGNNPAELPPAWRATFDGRYSEIGECWLWDGQLEPNGYAKIVIRGFGGNPVWAHRFSLLLVAGPSPRKRMDAMHSCDTRGCIRPHHLRWGTRSDNMQDALQKQRMVFARGERCGSSKLTAAQVMEARRRSASGEAGNDLAREFGVDPATMTRAIRGVTWSHLDLTQAGGS